jgi:SAM-dependent methyltransferase
MSESLTEPAKLLLLAALLTNDRIISNNGKSFLKELILRRDSRLGVLLQAFEGQNSGDSAFLETLHDLIMDEANQLYNELFFDTSLEVGKTLSKNERDDKLLSQEKSLIYGEVEFNSFYRVLRKINPQPGLVFYDLGSGTGKAVMAARFAYDFSKCIGIEILTSLHEQAERVLHRYNADFKNSLALGQSQHAMVYEGSFLDFDWSDGELVFANSTCFDDQLMQALSDMAGRLKPGAIVVTFTKGMSSDKFEVLERKRYRMSWGPATVFIHRRLKHDGKPVGPPQLNVLPSDDNTYEEYASPSNEDEDKPEKKSKYTGDDDEDDADDEVGART